MCDQNIIIILCDEEVEFACQLMHVSNIPVEVASDDQLVSRTSGLDKPVAIFELLVKSDSSTWLAIVTNNGG